MTEDFQYFLRLHKDASGRPYTQASWAKAIPMGRVRLCHVLGNVPGRGGVMRRKVAADIQSRFPTYADAMLALLGWDKSGKFVGWNIPHGTGTSVPATGGQTK